jgi:tetratricopeptide (TPR) repeat protein
MPRFSRLLLITTLWLAAGQLAPAFADVQSWDAPSCSLEKRLFADAADGRLDAFSTLEAALVAGGVEDADSLLRYKQKTAALVDELRLSLKPDDEPRRRVEAIFDFLHRRVLRGGYDLAYTDLRRVLDQRRFNCVSATVLFNGMAAELGMDCRAIQMPSHVLSRVVLPDGPMDVENTCPDWFYGKNKWTPQRPMKTGTVAENNAPTSPHTACAEYKESDRSKAREVSTIQLLAMIYFNRGVDLLHEKRFAEAARANAKALRLDPSNATIRGNLLATLNNWSIELGNVGQYAQAVDLLRQGLAMDPKFKPFLQNFLHVHRQWADSLIRQGHSEEAAAMLARAKAEVSSRKAQGN